MSKTELVFTHQPTCLHVSEDGQTVQLQAVLNRPGDREHFGDIVEPTPLPSCSTCIWNRANISHEKPITCTGMVSGTSIAANVDAQTGEMIGGLQIPESATLIIGTGPGDTNKFLETQTPVSASPFSKSTVFKYPRFPCAQPTDVTVPLAEINPEL